MLVIGVILVIPIFLTVFLGIFHYTTNLRKYWEKRNVPYREPCPIFGNFGATFTMKMSYTKMMQVLYAKFRNEKYFGIFQARRPALLVIDLTVVKDVLITKFSQFTERTSAATDIVREPLLRNLANMRGDEWRNMRQIVSPTFSAAKMKAMFPLIVECAKTLTTVLLTQNLEEVDVPNITNRYTTDVIGSCCFGVDPGSLKSTDSPFLKMSQKMFKASRSLILKRYCRAYFPRLFKFLNLRTYPHEVEVFITSVINQVLKQRRLGEKRNDFLQLMLNAQQSDTSFPITDELIISNSFIFMLAGLETSAATFSFCLYELAKNQEIQEDLRKEINECTKKNGGLNFEAVCSMDLTLRTVLETLRIHPPAPFTSRVCTAPCEISGTSFAAQPQDNIIIPIHCIQMDPQNFPEPEKFNPDRFKDNYSPAGFLSFGDGPRQCQGARFAQLMILAGLAETLSAFVVEPCSKTTPKIEYDPRSFMLKNKGGIWLRFSPLNDLK